MMKSAKTWARGRPLALSLAVVALAALAGAGAPTVDVWQALTPPEGIYTVSAGGTPSKADLVLSLKAAGMRGERLPVDALFVIDCSTTSALGEAKAIAFDLLDLLGAGDRAGLVVFSTTARLVAPVVADRAHLRTAIADLEASGKSALGDALGLARTELLRGGREDAVLVVFLLTDGQSNVGRAPDVEGKVAGEAGIRIVSVGIGTLINRSLLQALADDSGGVFLARWSESMRERANQVVSVDRAATAIRVDKTLPAELAFVRAAPSPTRVTPNADGTTHLVWDVSGLALGETWQTRIELQARVEGTFTTDVSSFLMYTSFRGAVSRVEIPGVELKAFVRQEPTAAFVTDPLEPRVGMEVALDAGASASGEPFGRGRIVTYAWDFDGNGTFDLISSEPRATYTFAEAGEVPVTLQIVDDIGKTATVRQLVLVAAGVEARREIETCLPDDQAIAAEVVRVKVIVRANATIKGLTLHETYPAGWTLNEVDNAGATFRKATADWVFPEELSSGEPPRVITYTLTAPAQTTVPTSPEKEPRADSIQGVVASSSPRISVRVLGEDKIVFRSTLPIRGVIGYWDVAGQKLAPCLEGGGVISFAQIQYAISLWVADQAVPYTGGLKIDSATLRDLNAYWLLGISVWEPLPPDGDRS